MAIFNSYVKLSEGNSELQRQQKSAFDLLQDVDIIRRQADSEKGYRRLGEGSVDGYFLDFSGRQKKYG